MKKITIPLLFQLFVVTVWGQIDSSWNVLLLEKGNNFEIKPNMATLNKTGFYLFKNCVYEIDLKNQKHISGRLIDVKPDTLVFTNFFNANVAFSAGAKLDTFAIHYKNLDKINLISDRTLGLYNKYSFDNYNFIFKRDTANYSFPSNWVAIYNNDSLKYELVAHLTEQGINTLFEDNGRTYYFYGKGMTKLDRSKIDTTFNQKNIFWFTPCNIEKINGVAIGFYTKNWKNDKYNLRDTLIINGLNLEINPFGFIAIFNPERLNGPYPDSLSYYYKTVSKDWRVKVRGVNISLTNTINEMRIKGFNLTGLFTAVDEINGVTISGFKNFSYLMNGVSIAGIQNRATLAKGVQIGLFNKATDMIGFQFGLWNENGKRSLPFVNWQFKLNK